MTTLDGVRRPRKLTAGVPRPARATPRAGSRASRSAAAADREITALSYYLVAGAALLLLAIGVVMVLSASTIESIRDNDGNPYAEFVGQAKFVLIGLPLGIAASRVPVEWYRRLAWPAFIGALGLQMLIFSPLARGQGGNVNWIYLPGVGQTVQPSEFLKLALALWLGLVLARKGRLLADWRHVLLPGIVGAGAAVGLVMAGHDMGTVLVIVALVAGAYFVAGLPLRWFGVAGVLGAGATAFLVALSPSRVNRVMSFLGASEADPSGVGFQTRHGLWGLGTGGVSGIGLGASREKWSYLPEAQNDFIFAILGEELGLFGTLVVLGLFAVLALGMFRVVRRHRDPFAQITTAAIATWILAQALVNIGVVIGLLPVIGVPLPLVSAGGSAMISSLMAIGVVLAFARTEPGAARALASRKGVVRRSLAVVGGRRRG
ncbi:FtsW/RodA/SpoVE family cell cycle protein [Georgenia yuyongxinii]|uniref:Probable peptidoglycan glycosyltransferase FtsW n=1 Tax=Georgenia yuyongxinii TaxID=2589797 RepID=A0A552WJB2_9MICO|nr:putative peptidoglycan glycosyltransferase FtsW [Georgenia yuyongxinii]TRW42816.1 cell division protein FtsW [Georgenia yuyongxinii]